MSAITLLAGVGFAIYSLRIDEIRVTGLHSLAPRTVVDVARVRTGERLLWIRLSVISRRVERIPTVAEATVERSLPNTLVIHIQEREPIARVGNARLLAVDAEGRVFPSEGIGGLPQLEGWRGSAAPGSALDKPTRTVLDAYVLFPAELRSKTARIVVGPPFSLWLADGTEIRFGRLEDLVRKAYVAQSVLRAEGGKPLAYIDVRAPSFPVSRLRAPPTPVPTTPPPARSPAPDSTRAPSTPAATRAATPVPTGAATPVPAPSPQPT